MPIFATMVRMLRHIETLLRRHDYVIVPGLGGFVYQYQSAVITKDSIVPPTVTVSFNPLMNISDGLLAIETSRMEGVSFREASSRITQEVEKVKAVLNEKKVVEIGLLGSLQISDEGKLIFNPSLSGHAAPANFGLSTLHYSPAQQEPERKVIAFSMPPARKIAQYAAIGILAVGLFFAAPQINDTAKNLANLLPTKKSIPVVENTVVNEPLKIVIPQSELQIKEQISLAEELKHHVIVSCMATQKDADELRERLHQMNYNQAHVLPPIKTFRVAIQSFGTKDEAVQFMQNLRTSTPQFSDAWVLSEK